MKHLKRIISLILILSVTALIITPTSNFEVSAASKTSINKATVKLSSTSYSYNGKAKTPSVIVSLKSKTLKKNKDYTVTYSSNIKAGTAKVIIKGKGNYTGSVTKKFTIYETTYLVTSYYQVSKTLGGWARDYFKISYQGSSKKINSIKVSQKYKQTLNWGFYQNDGIKLTSKSKDGKIWYYTSKWKIKIPSPIEKLGGITVANGTVKYKVYNGKVTIVSKKLGKLFTDII